MPGRVNLIGEHIDYHLLPVLPMAIQQRVSAEFLFCNSPAIHVESAGWGVREFRLGEPLSPSPAGDWANYLKAAVQAALTKWHLRDGFRARITSDLPSAAGLSSSSALLTAFTLGLLRANGIESSLEELMSILPEGEYFVGTRGGGMDHAAVLASRAGYASLVHFAPFRVEYVPIPQDWRFIIAHSLTRAEKSGAANARYNGCRNAPGAPEHVSAESKRVGQAVTAMLKGDRERFGQLLNASHASLRDRLHVSSPALDSIVEVANGSGADGARLTGAGFGGCAIILCTNEKRESIVRALERDFYSQHEEYRRDEHIIFAEPSNGALNASGS